jgi:hypothetical protein
MDAEHAKAEAALSRIEELGGTAVWEPDMCVVSLQGQHIDDDNVKVLVHLPAIQILSLSDTCVSDAVFEVLEELPALETVNLTNTRITPAGANDFLKKRPDVEIRTARQHGINPFTGEPF